MEEKNELNDIILNKGTNSSSNKKIILAVAALGVILIIVVMLMNSLTSSGTDNLPQAVLPPEPKIENSMDMNEEPLFEEVEVIQDESQNNADLDQIAQRLKEESQAESEPEVITPVTESLKEQKAEAPKPVATPKPAPAPKSVATTGSYYIQVGSFSKYEPNKQFLQSITDKGFKYRYHKVTVNSKTLTKVLVGPFNSEKDARTALRTVRSSIEAGAFLTKL